MNISKIFPQSLVIYCSGVKNDNSINFLECSVHLCDFTIDDDHAYKMFALNNKFENDILLWNLIIIVSCKTVLAICYIKTIQ